MFIHLELQTEHRASRSKDMPLNMFPAKVAFLLVQKFKGGRPEGHLPGSISSMVWYLLAERKWNGHPDKMLRISSGIKPQGVVPGYP